jgi:hypothetical protein
MKTISYLLIAFIFGGIIFIETPKYCKPKSYVIKIDNTPILEQKKEFNQWTVKINKQHQEIETILDSIK